MYHSIIFGNKNTWTDWHLVPASRPVFKPPSQKKMLLDIPAGNGSIDLSDSLTHYPVFNNSEGSFEFIVMNDYLPWNETYSAIMDYLHGQKLRAVLEDDPEYYREGRFTVNEWKSDKDYSRITINYSVSPYKIRQEETIIETYVTVTAKTITIRKEKYGQMPSCPTLIADISAGKSMTVTFTNKALNLSVKKTVTSGEYTFPEFVLYGDSASVKFKVEDGESYLQDSSGGYILDSSDNKIRASLGAHITIKCKYGRLG